MQVRAPRIGSEEERDRLDKAPKGSDRKPRPGPAAAVAGPAPLPGPVALAHGPAPLLPDPAQEALLVEALLVVAPRVAWTCCVA